MRDECHPNRAIGKERGRFRQPSHTEALTYSHILMCDVPRPLNVHRHNKYIFYCEPNGVHFELHSRWLITVWYFHVGINYRSLFARRWMDCLLICCMGFVVVARLTAMNTVILHQLFRTLQCAARPIFSTNLLSSDNMSLCGVNVQWCYLGCQ